MATEFPTLGSHCAHPECNQLDFLPVKCNGCRKNYCNRHFTYESHDCSSGLRVDVQVPVCPLCNQPVPTGKNEIADVVVGAHIDNECQSDPARKKRAYVNSCSLLRCKGRELVPIVCGSCRRNFCIKHRHTDDHECRGLKPNPLLKPLAGGQQTKQPRPNVDNDEALARMLQQKLNSSNGDFDPLEMDRHLAAQLQEEEYRTTTTVGGDGGQRRAGGQCNVS
ncbi:AN1-type zinc finger protein 2B-like Protein [Aphelenchoides fujianensis]|nr:AN1-type zinc finger protein 2B-like Protein [Aphelenchoides fujianensis]